MALFPQSLDSIKFSFWLKRSYFLSRALFQNLLDFRFHQQVGDLYCYFQVTIFQCIQIQHHDSGPLFLPQKPAATVKDSCTIY